MSSKEVFKAVDDLLDALEANDQSAAKEAIHEMRRLNDTSDASTLVWLMTELFLDVTFLSARMSIGKEKLSRRAKEWRRRRRH